MSAVPPPPASTPPIGSTTPPQGGGPPSDGERGDVDLFARWFTLLNFLVVIIVAFITYRQAAGKDEAEDIRKLKASVLLADRLVEFGTEQAALVELKRPSLLDEIDRHNLGAAESRLTKQAERMFRDGARLLTETRRSNARRIVREADGLLEELEVKGDLASFTDLDEINSVEGVRAVAMKISSRINARANRTAQSLFLVRTELQLTQAENVGPLQIIRDRTITLGELRLREWAFEAMRDLDMKIPVSEKGRLVHNWVDLFDQMLDEGRPLGKVADVTTYLRQSH